MSFLEGTEDGRPKEMRKFNLPRFFSEFSAPTQLSPSDCQPLTVKETTDLMHKPESEDIEQLWRTLELGYGEMQGYSGLREEIAKFYENKISADDVLVCAPEEGILLFMSYFLKEGDEIVVTWPIHQSLYETARSKGCRIKQWNCDFTTEKEPIFRVDDLQNLITPGTKLLVINFPHNPTGFIPTAKEFKEIIPLCEANDCFIFSDEMYRGIQLEEKYNLPSCCQLTKHCVVLSGLSKVLNMPGTRIGWLIVQDREILLGVNQLKDYTSICASVLSEVFAMVSLRNSAMLLKQNIETVRENLNHLKTFCDEFSMFEFYTPRGSSICFIKVNATDVHAFALNLIQKEGIVIVPGSIFTTNKNDDIYCRVRIGLGRKNFLENLEKLKTVLRTHN